MSIFRAYDIRGIYPKDLDEEIALKIGKAFGTYNPGKIVVGMDTRLSSPSLKKELINGLLSVGVNVIDIGMVTTPMLMFTTRHLNCDGGVMVSASHNPKQFNGFKFYRKNAIPISYESGIKEIQKIFGQEKFSEGKGTLTTKDITEDYSNFLLSKINLEKPINLKIVVDAGNGPTGIINPKVFKKLDINVYELYCKPDGNFPNHEPNPSKPKNLVDIKKKVVKENANLGFAYDGDGDRVAVIDVKQDVLLGTIEVHLDPESVSMDPDGTRVYVGDGGADGPDPLNGPAEVHVIDTANDAYLRRIILRQAAKIALTFRCLSSSCPTGWDNLSFASSTRF